LLDRFGLQANVESLTDVEERVAIVKVAEQFDADPEGFRKSCESQQRELGEKISNAETILPDARISDDLLRTTAEMCIELGVRTHRAEIVITRTAKTIAAFDSRTEVTLADIKEAMELALPHRMRKKPFEPPELDTEKLDRMMEEKSEEKSEEKQKPDEESEQPEHKNENEHKHEQDQDREQGPQEIQDPPDSGDERGTPQESVFEVGSPIDAEAVRPKQKRDRTYRTKTSGRRIPTLTLYNRGRYARHTLPRGKPTDIAIDATICAAAPHQRGRCTGEDGGAAILIRDQDIREKIRVGKVSTATLFVVDASGSMGASNRMESAKGAVLSLLLDSYQQRDRLGMVAFRGNAADVLLPLSRSADLAFKQLYDLPTGGKTPLSAGLSAGLNLLLAELKKNEETIPIMILISDGRANVALGDASVKEELLGIAEDARSAGIHVVVLDTESAGRAFVKMQLGYCKDIAEHAGGRYYSVEDLSSGTVRNIVATEQEMLVDIHSMWC